MILGKGKLVRIIDRTKELRYPNSPGQHGAGHLVPFNTLVLDQWYPAVGIGDGSTFTVPISGLYSLYFEVRQPDYHVAGIGFGNGWSGDGSGAAWIRTLRGGGTLEDNIARQSWSANDAATDNHWMFCGPTNRSLLAGDQIQCWTDGAATGVGVFDWDAHLIMIKKRG